MKNRLKGTRCYLSGHMENFTEGDMRTWRQEIGKELKKLGVTVLDPTNKPIELGEEVENRELFRQLAKEENYTELARRIKIVRCIDLRMVDISDFMIVNMDTEIPTAGTHEEIALANRQKKPIIIRVKQGKQNCPLWLFGMIPHQMIFSSWSEVIFYLNHIHCDYEIAHYRRWWFFDLAVDQIFSEEGK